MTHALRERICILCWTRDKHKTPAVRSIAGDDLCEWHVVDEGHTMQDGEVITPAVPFSSPVLVGENTPRRKAVSESEVEAKRMYAKDPKSCIDCGRRVRKDSKDGRCKDCRKAHKDAQTNFGTEPKRRGRPPKGEKRIAKSAHRANGRGLAGGANGSAVVALRVSEQQLNDFILKLLLEQRAEMVNAYLAGGK